MIEFNGYLSGSAKKRFFRRAKTYAQTQFLAGGLLSVVTWPYLAKTMQVKISLTLVRNTFFGVGAACLIVIFLIHIVQGRLEKRNRTPRKIVFQDGMAICIMDKYQECRNVSDVKCVRDYGEFYELVFPLSKMSEKYICQKSLLTKGSLGEFERLFEGKIENKCKKTIACTLIKQDENANNEE